MTTGLLKAGASYRNVVNI